MIRVWIYFGCHREAGHYLWSAGMQSYRYHGNGRLSSFDGLLAPQDSPAPYRACFYRLGGWGASALSFWDNSVDHRAGSNSIFFAPSLTITPEKMMAEAKAIFPEVWSRLPEIEWHSSVTIGGA